MIRIKIEEVFKRKSPLRHSCKIFRRYEMFIQTGSLSELNWKLFTKLVARSFIKSM